MPPSNRRHSYSGCSVVRSSRLVWDQEVASSNLAIPTPKSVHYSISGRFFYVVKLLILKLEKILHGGNRRCNFGF